MKPPWLRRTRRTLTLTPQAWDHAVEVAAGLNVDADVVIDAAARVITSEQVQAVVAQDTADIVHWRRRKS